MRKPAFTKIKCEKKRIEAFLEYVRTHPKSGWTFTGKKVKPPRGKPNGDFDLDRDFPPYPPEGERVPGKKVRIVTRDDIYRG